MKSMSRFPIKASRTARDFVNNCGGVAAVEFAFILPLMLVLFFGTIDFSQGVAVSRKVTIMARTLADLTSQNTSVTTTQLDNFFTASTAVMTPYPAAPVQATLSELYVDPSTLQARVQWSRGVATRAVSSPVAIPTQLQIGGTYLLMAEVSYLFVPTIGYVMAPSGIVLRDVAYTRPRQNLGTAAACVFYPPTTATSPVCPTS
jgi:Flp pilus assembly protein TadG